MSVPHGLHWEGIMEVCIPIPLLGVMWSQVYLSMHDESVCASVSVCNDVFLCVHASVCTYIVCGGVHIFPNF